MADDPGAALSSMAKDLDLLSSGNFADVEVICGDRTWKCHRAILVPRSIWFEKALAGPFEEASTRQVKLNEENPACVDLALKYIYGRGLDVESSVSPEHFVEHCVSLWHIADFLLLHPLKSPLEKAVHSYCDKRMKEHCTFGKSHLKWRDNDHDSKLSPWAQDLLSGVRESYKWDVEHFKAVLMEFLWVGRTSTLSKGKVSALILYLKDTPRFMDDFLSTYASRHWISNAVWAPAPRPVLVFPNAESKCRRCEKEISWESPNSKAGQVIDPFEASPWNSLQTGWCRDCAKLDMIPWRT